MRKNDMYWFLFQIACGLICLFSWTQPGQAARYLLLGLLFLRITLFLLVWKNGDRAVRWLAGRHTPVGDLELKELRGELFDVLVLAEFMILGNAVPRLAVHGPEFRRYDALAWFTIALVIYYLVNSPGLRLFLKGGWFWGIPWVSIALLLLVYKNSGIFIADAGDQMFVIMVIMHLELVASTLVRMYLKGKERDLNVGQL